MLFDLIGLTACELVLLASMAGNDYAPHFFGHRMVGLKSILVGDEAAGIRAAINNNPSLETFDSAVDKFAQWCDLRKAGSKKKCQRECFVKAEGDHSRCPDVIPGTVEKMKTAVRVFLEDHEIILGESTEPQAKERYEPIYTH